MASKDTPDDEWESPPSSPKHEAPRHKPFALPQELRKGARNIQFVLEHQSDPPPPSTPTSPKLGRTPPPIPEKPVLARRESANELEVSPQPTLNTKPAPPPKPISKRMSIDATSLQEVSKAMAEVEENGKVESDAERRNNRKSMGGTFSGRNLKDRLDVLAKEPPPPLPLPSPGKEPRSEPKPEEKKKPSSISSSIKALLPKSRSTTEKPPLVGAFEQPPSADDKSGLSSGRTTLAQSAVLPATSPRPSTSGSNVTSLRTSVQSMFGRRSEKDIGEDGSESSSAPNSTPASPRGALHSSTDDCPMAETFSVWDTQPTPEHLLTWRPAPASAAPDGSAAPLIALTDGGQWRQEQGAVLSDEKETALYTALTLNYAEEEHHYYAEGIHPREHTTWVTTGPEDPTLGPLVMSVENLAPGQKSVRILLRARTGDTRVSFPIQKGQPRDVIRAFTEETPQYDKVKWKEVGDDDMERELLDMERKAVRLLKSYKIGLLLCLEGQKDESEMLRNRDSTPAFDEFLELIGERVELLGFEGYNGGLDTSKNKTGTQSIVTSVEGHNLMWHVSTLLPFFPDDAQQLERKRHLGNDVVTVVFKEGNTPFNPACLTSQFTHAVCVVQKVENSTPTQYRVAFAYRNGCRPHTPLLTHPCIYTKGPDFKRFLLTKLVNAERAAFHAPAFAEKFSKVRLLMLRELVIKAASSVPRRSVIGKAGSVIAAPIVSALPLVSPKRNTAGGSRIERPLATDRGSRSEPVPMEPLSSARSSDDNTVHSGSRIARTGTTDKDRERERKEKEKLDKEREKADKKEKERLEKEKKKDDKEQAKLVKSGSKEPTPRTDDPRQLNCLWIDKTSEFSPLIAAWSQTYPNIFFKTFVSLDELTFWINARESKIKGLEFRVVCCRSKETDVAEVEALVSWVRFSSPLSRSKILIYTSTPAGLDSLVSAKRTYLAGDATFCTQFATYKFNDS